jgi:hypothetical protein
MMPSLSYPASFGLKTKTIEITPVMGTGEQATWHVYVDRYFAASVSWAGDEILVHPAPGTWMSGDDIGALREVVEAAIETNKK